jgi:hypothetical protein
MIRPTARPRRNPPADRNSYRGGNGRGAAAAVPSVWVRVTKRHPCPICGKGDWCGTTGDGQIACTGRDSGTNYGG